MISFADLLTPLTQDQVRATMVTTLKGLGIDASKWKSGGTMSTVLTVVAGTFASFTSVIALGLGAGFLETSSGGWLKLLAFYVYGVTVPDATFASGAVSLTAGGTTLTYGIGQATFLDPVTKNTYVNTSAISVAPGQTQTGIGIECTVAGSSGSAPPGEITGFVTTMLGASVTNPAAVVGLDAPDDPTIRQLCLDKLGAMSVRGPRSAYSYSIRVATNVLSGAPVNINRWWISPSAHQGTVTVNVASPAGAPDPNDVAGVVASIEAIARPEAVTVSVNAATAVPYAANLVVYCTARPGLSTQAVQQAVQAALLAFFKSYPLGGLSKVGAGGVVTGSGVWASGVDGAVKSADPGIFAVDGAIDLALSPTQVASNQVAVSVVLVTPLSNAA